MSIKKLKGSMEWALMVALIFGGGAIARAQNDQAAQNEGQPPGKIVRIGPTGGGQIAVAGKSIDQPVMPDRPMYWIGLLGGPVSDELRAQTDIPAGQGVLVRQVVPESPADKAGVKVFDILLRANDTDLTDIADLTELVQSQGESGGQIALDVLRRGQHESITVAPEARPEQPMPQFGHRGQPFQFHMFRPGTLLNGHPGRILAPPNGVSVSIQRQNDEPAQITVKRGDETWNVVGDDPGSLEQLPEDVRPFVEQLLWRSGGAPLTLPALPHSPDAFQDDAFQQRLHKMEQQLQQMQLMLEHDIEPPHAEDHAETDAE